MPRLNWVSDLREHVVVDTSVAINLNATGCAATILRALPYGLTITDAVESELEHDRRTGRRDAVLLTDLVRQQLVAVVLLDEAALQVFGELVAGPAAETLDDGEAATIAYAVTRGVPAVIDERKARRICAQRFSELQILSTMDLLADDAVQAALGRQALSDAVFHALRDARMRVLPGQVGWVVVLIGADRASQCPSLPRNARPGSL